MSIARTIQFRAPLTMSAAADATTPKRFAGVAYTGAVVNGGLVIDLSSTTVPQSMALLEEHDRTSIIGQVESTMNRGGQLAVSGQLYSDVSPKAGQIARLATRGFPFQMSVGVYGYSEETLSAGQRLSVNGRDITGPALVLKNGTVRECSVCTLGADPKTNVQFFSANGLGRTAAIERLFADLGEVIDPQERAAYLSMSPASFALFDQKLRQLADRLAPAASFALRAATLDAAKPPQLSSVDVYKRRAAAAKRFH